MADLYDEDTVLWSEVQAVLLRRRAAGELVNEADIDWANVAEEIESLGKSQARELLGRLLVVMEHLMKLEASDAAEPRAGWRATVRRERGDIEIILDDAPSLRGRVPAMIAAHIGKARMRAIDGLADHGERPRVDLGSIAYDAEQVIGDWFPDTRMDNTEKAVSL